MFVFTDGARDYIFWNTPKYFVLVELRTEMLLNAEHLGKPLVCFF